MTLSRDPWFKFFPSDWRGDEGLQLCSLAARGLWMELICYMHKADPYGHLVIDGKAPTTDDLIRRLRPRSKSEFTTAFAELREHGVYSITEQGVIYSRRMVRRGARIVASRENGHLGGRPRREEPRGEPRQEPSEEPSGKPRPNQRPNPQKLEARNQKPEPDARGRPPLSRSKRPIFTGQRLTVFEWMLDDLMRILGKYADSFGIDEWFYEADRRALAEASVIRDDWRWLRAATIEEAKRRGLPFTGDRTSGSGDDYDGLPWAWQCKVCGEVHEGTREQERQRPCLKKAS